MDLGSDEIAFINPSYLHLKVSTTLTWFGGLPEILLETFSAGVERKLKMADKKSHKYHT